VKHAHAKGALAYIDAVHYTPHGPIDVRALDVTFWLLQLQILRTAHGISTESASTCSAWRPYKLRANSEAVPFRWEWGTLNHECIAGITACVEYLADIGRTLGPSKNPAGSLAGCVCGDSAARTGVSRESDPGLLKIRGFEAIRNRRPQTFRSTLPDSSSKNRWTHPPGASDKTSDRGFFTWDGNLLCPKPDERLDVEKMAASCESAWPITIPREVDRLLQALNEIV